VEGCTDADYTEFDAAANVDDGSCATLVLADCMEADACNYNAAANVAADNCLYPLDLFGIDYVTCVGACLNDSDGDGICDEEETGGCQDASACNFSGTATDDDGSCEWCSCAELDLNPGADTVFFASDSTGYGLKVVKVAYHSEGALAGQSTYRFYVTGAHPADQLSSVWGNAGHPLSISTTTSFHQDALGGNLGTSINPLLFGLVPELAFDSWVTIGLDQTPSAAAGEGDVQAIVSPNQNWIVGLEAGTGIEMNDATGGAWFVTNNLTNGAAAADTTMLIMQLTTDGVISGTLNFQVFEAGNSLVDVRPSVTFTTGDMTTTISEASCGCMDPWASNYDALATLQDGNCIYPGCTDPAADNYDAGANADDGSCYLAGCTVDGAENFNPSATDDDGSCVVYGCTDATATNYNSEATTDDGNCFVTGCLYMLAGNYNPAVESDDGSCELGGCTNPIYRNYSSYANVDNGSCSDAPPCPDSNDDGYIGAVELTDMLSFYNTDGSGCGILTPLPFEILIDEPCDMPGVQCGIEGCMYPGAVNFDQGATIENGSCLWTGCSDPEMQNFNPLVNLDDGTCVTPVCWDFDFNGFVGIQDLLDLLLLFNSDCGFE
jgi:hypothetical protein